jgi:hypothetical protein
LLFDKTLTGEGPHETINTDPGSPPKAALPILAKGALRISGADFEQKMGIIYLTPSPVFGMAWGDRSAFSIL